MVLIDRWALLTREVASLFKMKCLVISCKVVILHLSSFSCLALAASAEARFHARQPHQNFLKCMKMYYIFHSEQGVSNIINSFLIIKRFWNGSSVAICSFRWRLWQLWSHWWLMILTTLSTSDHDDSDESDTYDESDHFYDSKYSDDWHQLWRLWILCYV